MPEQQATDSPRVSTMDAAHRMDWDILNIGYPQSSQKMIHLIDMDLHIFGLEEIAGSTRPIAVIILSHGWANKARDMWPMASGLIGEANRLDTVGGRKRTRDVIVVTLDQRNHGDRRRVRTKVSFETNAYRFGIDMAMGLTGAKQDHHFLMEFLEGHLFPSGDRQVVEYMVAGFSMGGHVAWRLLREDDRIRIGVPICSLPSETLGRKLLNRELPPNSPPSHVPPVVERFFNTPSPPGTYAGKCILAIHGGLDAVLPWTLGDDRWLEIAQEAKAAERYVQPDAGHIVSQEMVRRTAEWLWRYGLTEEA